MGSEMCIRDSQRSIPEIELIFKETNSEALAHTPHSANLMSSKPRGTLAQPERQFLYADFGTTSGLNQFIADEPFGLAGLVLLKVTSKPAELFVPASKVLKLMSPELGILSTTIIVDPKYPKRNEYFQRIIHADNSCCPLNGSAHIPCAPVWMTP